PGAGGELGTLVRPDHAQLAGPERVVGGQDDGQDEAGPAEAPGPGPSGASPSSGPPAGPLRSSGSPAAGRTTTFPEARSIGPRPGPAAPTASRLSSSRFRHAGVCLRPGANSSSKALHIAPLSRAAWALHHYPAIGPVPASAGNRPSRWATAAASPRPETPSLARMLETWTLAVLGEMNSS